MTCTATKLPKRHEVLIAALIQQPTVETAAAATGISVRTAQVWMALPGFDTAFRAARRAIVDHALTRLQVHVGAAVATLQRNLAAKRASDRNQAAKILLDHALRTSFLDAIIEDVEKLKAAAAARNNRRLVG